MNEIDNLQYRKSALIKHRAELIQQIADFADEIKGIDQQLAILRSCELEHDLNQAAEAHS